MTPAVAIFIAKPGCEAELEALFLDVIAPTHAEQGCRQYQLNRDVENSRRFVWTELWDSRAELDRHLGQTHITELFLRVPELVEHSEVIVLEKVDGGIVR